LIQSPWQWPQSRAHANLLLDNSVGGFLLKADGNLVDTNSPSAADARNLLTLTSFPYKKFNLVCDLISFSVVWKPKALEQHRTLNDRRKVAMSKNGNGAVLVVGGGIAGMQAALDLADSGFYVHLVERSTAIGGVMAQLDKTFPTNDCSM
jgi:heterodisulfide reductase subunit A